MSKKSANINKRKSGVNTLGDVDAVGNSEPNSELLKKKIEELNGKFKERSIKARILSKQNYLYIRGTFTDSKGARKDRKIPLRLSTDISNLVSAEARILQLMEYIKKNGFIPEELLWDAPKVEISGGGITVAEGIAKLEIEYWKDKDRNKEIKQRTWNLQANYLKKLPQNAVLTLELLLDSIQYDSHPESDKRRKLCQFYKKLGLLNGIENLDKIDKFVGRYIPKTKSPIDEHKFVQLIDMVRDNKKWGWLTAAQYVYGTRSGETFSLVPDIASGTATSVNIPKAKKAMHLKYPIALTKELAQKWELENIERPYSFDLNNYSPSQVKYLGNQWLRYLKPRARELGIDNLQLTSVRHHWGIRSIHADIDARAASKSLGHDINTHFRIYNSTYDQLDAIKASKKLNK